jgi:mannose-6-phosphate isomerase-like protein (cupin superfamily)
MEKVSVVLCKEVYKIWGKEIWMANTPLYCGKKLILKKGKRCSFHYHKIKDETFYIDSGRVMMERRRIVGEAEVESRIMVVGDVLRIPPGVPHRFSGLEDSVIIEISTHHEDSDSYRIEGELSGDIPDGLPTMS